MKPNKTPEGSNANPVTGRVMVDSRLRQTDSLPNRMAVANIRIVNTQLDSANCKVPLMP